jgi:hypothetical protein
MHPLVLVVIALVFWANAHRPIVAATPPNPIFAACSSDGPGRSEEARISSGAPAGRSRIAARFGTRPKRGLLARRACGADERSASS